jgi:hypothetical protein
MGKPFASLYAHLGELTAVSGHNDRDRSAPCCVY